MDGFRRRDDMSLRKVEAKRLLYRSWPFPASDRPSLTSRFSSLLPATTMPNVRVLRDIKARNIVNANEVARRAYLYVARNQTLPPQVRYQAQLQLNTFDKYARPTTVKNRCTDTGRGRGIMSEFGLCRVCI